MTSFPYFALARRHDADYGLVLAYAGMQERLLTFDPPTLDEQTRTAANMLSDDCRHAIKAAVYLEHRRRGQVLFKVINTTPDGWVVYVQN